MEEYIRLAQKLALVGSTLALYFSQWFVLPLLLLVLVTVEYKGDLDEDETEE